MTAPRIAAFPPPRLTSLWSPAPHPDPLAPFAGLYSSGRTALYRGLQGLGLPRGTTVWMPAFQCGVEVQAALALGLEVGFYRVDGGLRADLDDLDRRLKQSPGPVLLIHYFGFAQPDIAAAARLCESHGVVLIEDCAHALFSRHGGQELGSYAPLAIFSLRKTLAVYDGGALLVNPPLLARVARDPFPPPPPGDASPAAYRDCAKSVIRNCAGADFTAAYHRLRWGAPAAETHTPEWARPPQYRYGMSRLSRRLARAENPAEVAERRRRNWSVLHERLSGAAEYRPVFRALPPEACPLVLPVWTARRNESLERLGRQGIEPFIFGAVAHTSLDTRAFPETQRLREQIVGIPVHQHLAGADLNRLAAAFEAAPARVQAAKV